MAAVFNAQQLDAVACALSVAEVADVLARARIRERVPAERAEEFLDNVAILFDLVDEPAQVEPLLRRPRRGLPGVAVQVALPKLS